MLKRLVKEGLGWGIVLWLVGYILGFVFYFVLPSRFVGWAIMPIGIALTWWVLVKKIKAGTLSYLVILGLVWMIIAVVADYFLLVKVLHPADGYYKLDVYIYYLSTITLPVLAKIKNKNLA